MGSSLKHKLSSSLCCCLSPSVHDDEDRPTLIRSASAVWSQELPQLKDKCKNLISRIRGRRRCSGDFKYDPLSYALNFDEGGPEFVYDDDAGVHTSNFTSRLPASPPPPVRGEIFAL
ncbi:hypothetical protein ACHQM5_001132 [Ranunculus cassubicifolius]